MAKILIITALVITFCCGSALAADPIKLGAAIPETGPYASVGQTMLRAYEMAADEYNAQGGLLGRPIKIISGDVSDCLSENTTAVAERLIAAGVDMVNTGYDSFSNANIKTYGKYDVPYLTGTAFHIVSDAIEEGMPQTNNCFEYVWDELSYGKNLLDELFEAPKKMGWTPPNKKIAVIKVDFSYAMAPADLFIEGAKAMGYEVVMDEVIQFGKIDFGTILSKIERLQPSFIFFTDPAPDDAARFQIQFYDRFAKKGLEAIVVSQYAPSTPEYMELVGKEKAEGVIYMGGSVRQWLPPNKAFLDRWVAKYNEEPFDPYALICYDGVQLWAQAVKRVGDVKNYQEVCRLMRESVYDGLWGTYVFEPKDQTALYGEYLLAVDWVQIRNGVYLEVYPDRYKNAEYVKQPWMK